MKPGSLITLDIDKPAAGGRMIARHDGRVVLVAGAIPGERVDARVERVKGQVAFATVVGIVDGSPDRRAPDGDPWCGGSMFAHIGYERQLSLKREIVADAFRRLGHLSVPSDVPTHASPERGYRMRARLHVHDTHLGFYREGTHELCPPRSTGQLSADAVSVVEAVGRRLSQVRTVRGRTLDLLENRRGDERVVALDVGSGNVAAESAEAFVTALDGCTGVAVIRAGRVAASTGCLSVSDDLGLHGVDGRRVILALRRSVGAFFQGNRFLLETLTDRVVAHVPRAAVIDLYAGCGLFGLAVAASGAGPVRCVEGDRTSVKDLRVNAAPFGTAVSVIGESVEAYLARHGSSVGATVIVDPPRTGLSADAAAGLASVGASRIVYVSCDVATLARDARRLHEAGYSAAAVEIFDLFPNTAHVESMVIFDRVAHG